MPVESKVRLWRSATDYITLDYAEAHAAYAEHGERIRDRLGLVHRIAADSERYPVSLRLRVAAEELTGLNNESASVRRSIVEWIELWFQQSAELMVYVMGETLANDGSPLQRLLAYKCVIDLLPEDGFGSIASIASGAEYLEFSLLILQDGYFSNFDSLASYTARERP